MPQCFEDIRMAVKERVCAHVYIGQTFDVQCVMSDGIVDVGQRIRLLKYIFFLHYIIDVSS